MLEEQMVGSIARRIQQELAALSHYSATEKGVTRLPFTKEAEDALVCLEKMMKEAGLSTCRDHSGALHGFLPGKSEKRFIIGSHYDSVVEGGAYDGIAGVVCGIEIARHFSPNTLPFTLEIVAFNDEEGVRFGGGFLSSKALLGELKPAELKNYCDADGLSCYEAMQKFGYDPEKIAEDVWPVENIAGFLEIHIEQGARLYQSELPLGLVTGIVGMRRFDIEITGRADHAGTTPMTMRADALTAAAAFILTAQKAAAERAAPDVVATVGVCEVKPGTVNTVPAFVHLTLDVRSLDAAVRDEVVETCFDALHKAAAANDLAVKTQEKLTVAPVKMDETLMARLSEAMTEEDIPYMALASGAGHDALPIARRVPAAMLFVPSRDGRSHCPEEYSEPEDFARAVRVVIHMLEDWSE
ncbi:M20 family metallo-hydrolase [Mitsuokella sp. WILCCON 0060]|uniref:M20 family metallo-hydrolase n=1 Tax=Mitsuokella sp. WILCCON 0060 TaxID=3345341 RepID=UPI003F1AA09E